MTRPSAAALLEAMPAPGLVTDHEGTILLDNAPMRRLVGDGIGEKIRDRFGDQGNALAALIRRSLGQASPTIGAIKAPGREKAARWKVTSSRIASSDRNAMVLILLDDDGQSRFRALTSKVAELDREVVKRRRSEATLASSLEQRDLMFRELQHRVKNNLQMFAGMLHLQIAEAGHEEARTILRDVANRFTAIGAVQQLLYQERGSHSVRIDEILKSLSRVFVDSSGDKTRIEIDAAPAVVFIDGAIPMALIANELITNALRHGCDRNSVARVKLRLWQEDDATFLSVSDCGPGFRKGETEKRGSGLGLVRALARQLGGTFEIAHSGGADCRCRFPRLEKSS